MSLIQERYSRVITSNYNRYARKDKLGYELRSMEGNKLWCFYVAIFRGLALTGVKRLCCTKKQLVTIRMESLNAPGGSLYCTNYLERNEMPLQDLNCPQMLTHGNFLNFLPITMLAALITTQWCILLNC